MQNSPNKNCNNTHLQNNPHISFSSKAVGKFCSSCKANKWKISTLTASRSGQKWGVV